MAIALAQARVQSGSSIGATSLAATYGSATTAGNFLALLTTAAGATHNTPTDSAGNTWVQAGTTYNINGGNYSSCWYVANALGSAGTVTMNYGGSYIYRSLVIYEFSGMATSLPFDQEKRANGFGSSAATTGTFTLAAANELILAIMIGTPVITPDAAYTGVNFAITGDATKYFMDEYHMNVTANEAATATDGGTGGGIDGFSFKDAGGGAGTAAQNLLTLLGVGL